MKRKVAFVYVNSELNVGRGVGYVAGSVMRAGHILDFFDTLHVSQRRIIKAVKQGAYDIVMLSTMTMMFPETLRLIRAIKEQAPMLPVLVGGIHPTIIGASLLADHPEIDFLCVGEGESMVVEFLDKFGTKEVYEVNNLVYRGLDGTPVTNSLNPPEDLAMVTEFPWHLFPSHAVVQEGDNFLYVDATRGCPYNCTYCSNFIYLQYYGKEYLRFKPVDHVVDELVRLEKVYNPRLFYFGDEMILANMDYASALFRAMKERISTPFGCMSRVEHLNEKIANILYDSGCRYIAMGVECGDEKFRKEFLNRHMTNAQIESAFAVVKQANIFATSFNMIGFPVDYDDRLTDATFALNERMKPDYSQISIFFPFPGTKLYDYCLERDLIDPQKATETFTYHRDSVLRGVSLEARKDQLVACLNPGGWNFAFKGTDGKVISEKFSMDNLIVRVVGCTLQHMNALTPEREYLLRKLDRKYKRLKRTILGPT